MCIIDRHIHKRPELKHEKTFNEPEIMEAAWNGLPFHHHLDIKLLCG